MVSNGVLISNQWILTSASGLHWDGNVTTTAFHSTDYQETFEYPLANKATVFIGALNMSEASEPQRVVMNSRFILPHPHFKFFEFLNGKLPDNIALIKLPEPIEFNDFIRPIKLIPMNGESRNANNLTIVSYSGYKHSLMQRGNLSNTDLVMKPNKECQPTFPKGELTNDSYRACTAGLEFAFLGDQEAAMAHWDGNKKTSWTSTAIASKLNLYGRSI